MKFSKKIMLIGWPIKDKSQHHFQYESQDWIASVKCYTIQM